MQWDDDKGECHLEYRSWLRLSPCDEVSYSDTILIKRKRRDQRQQRHLSVISEKLNQTDIKMLQKPVYRPTQKH